MKKLVSMGDLVALGDVAINKYLGNEGLTLDQIRSGSVSDLELVDEVSPWHLRLADLLDILPRESSLLVAAAVGIGIDIGVADAQGMEVCEAARQCCMRYFGGTDQEEFWGREIALVDAIGDADGVQAALEAA